MDINELKETKVVEKGRAGEPLTMIASIALSGLAKTAEDKLKNAYVEAPAEKKHEKKYVIPKSMKARNNPKEMSIVDFEY